MQANHNQSFFLGAVPKKHLDSIEQQSFWQNIELRLRGKKIHHEQKVDAAVIFRFMIMQEVFDITLEDVKRDIEYAKKLNFIYNLQSSVPTQEDVLVLKELLMEKGYFNTIIERCQVHLNQLKHEEKQKRNIKLNQCPKCNSHHLFNLKPTLKQKLLGYKAYRCFECKNEFVKHKNTH